MLCRKLPTAFSIKNPTVSPHTQLDSMNMKGIGCPTPEQQHKHKDCSKSTPISESTLPQTCKYSVFKVRHPRNHGLTNVERELAAETRSKQTSNKEPPRGAFFTTSLMSCSHSPYADTWVTDTRSCCIPQSATPADAYTPLPSRAYCTTEPFLVKLSSVITTSFIISTVHQYH
jgi:hypothetical protein